MPRPVQSAAALVEVLAQDDELVAAEPADRVDGANDAADALGDLAQDAVAGSWPSESLIGLKWSTS